MHNEVNPFCHSSPAVGESFVGREEELNTLLCWLGTEPPTCIALYGPERIGKSSFLRQLCEVAGPQRYPSYRWVYLDLQGIFSPDEFWSALAKQLGVPEQDVFAALSRSPAPVVLCLDEFGAALSRPGFSADFYGLLCGFAITGKLTLVISTLRPLQELSIPDRADVSYFFSIFLPFPLGPLSPQASRKLLESRGLCGNDADWVLKNVEEHGHPYHLQLLGAYLWEARRSGRSPREAKEHYQQAIEWEEPSLPK
ncbi:MAG: ATP-binding protein [Candidatus Bathyarchaeia archaeon]